MSVKPTRSIVLTKNSAEPTDRNLKGKDLQPFLRCPEGQAMTTDQGLKISHTKDSLKSGIKGSSLLEDFHLREKLTRFDLERIPERVVHARGSAAHGEFELYESLSEFSQAGFLQTPGTKTPVFTRFSTVVGSRGSADTVRDVRGFAVKFYTQEGNFDLVGNNIPVFFIQDGIQFPDLVHAAKPEAHNEIPGASTAHDTFWDFVSLVPESTHMLMWVLSDRGIPRSYANMEGFGVHTFRLVNAKGESHFVKFHWKPLLGIDSLVWDEAQKLAGKDADFHRRSLWESVERGQGPEFELGVQIMTEAQVATFEFDILDPTKIVPEELVPVRIIGKMKLTRNPDNFFAETEQVAFCVSNLVPGIDVTNDPLLQARLFSYLDTQLLRLGGPNFSEIPINRPVVAVHNNQQDGPSRHTIVQGRANYFPNSIGGGCPFMSMQKEGGYVHFPEQVSGTKARERSPSFSDHYSQATLFFESLTSIEKKHLIEAACFELGKVEIEGIRERVVGNFLKVNVQMACEIALKIGVKVPENNLMQNELVSKVTQSAALSQINFAKRTIATRKVAVLIADGFSMVDLKCLRALLVSAGAMLEIVSPRLGVITSDEGEGTKADKSLLTVSSVFYDAVFIPAGSKHIATLKELASVKAFVQEAFQHCKTIGALDEAAEILHAAGIVTSREVPPGGGPEFLAANAGVIISEGRSGARNAIEDFVKSLAVHRHWER